MKKPKYYVVGEVGYEYNDEIYHRPNISGGAIDPMLVYKNEEKANKQANKLSIQKLKELCKDDWGGFPYGWGYEPDEAMDWERFSEWVEKYKLNLDLDNRDDNNDAENLLKFLKVLKEEDYEKFLKDVIHLKFYEVSLVTLGD